MLPKFFKMIVVYFYHIIFSFIKLFTKKKQQKAILLINYNNLGDLVCDSASIRNVRQSFPAHKIIMFVKNQSCVDFMKNYPYIDEIYEMPHSKDKINIVFKFALRFKQINFDFSMQFVRPFENCYRTMLPFIMGIKTRYGLKQKDKNYVYPLSFTKYVELDNTTTRIEESLGLLKLAKITISDSQTECFYDEKNAKIHIEQSYIMIQTRATMEARVWYYENFIKLINLIQEKHPKLIIVLSGTKTEENYLKQIKEGCHIKENIQIYTDLNYDTLFSLIKKASFLITNDTGPLHFAYALQTKTLAIFGISPAEYLYTENDYYHYTQGTSFCPKNCIVKKNAKHCESIYKHNNEKLNCINTIYPEQVFLLFEQLFC